MCYVEEKDLRLIGWAVRLLRLDAPKDMTNATRSLWSLAAFRAGLGVGLFSFATRETSLSDELDGHSDLIYKSHEVVADDANGHIVPTFRLYGEFRHADASRSRIYELF